MRVATVLYEDKMAVGSNGEYPPHDLVLRMVADQLGGEHFELRARVKPNPRNGVGNVIRDLGRTKKIAGSGHLFVVLDRDRVAEHLPGSPRPTTDAAIVAALVGLSDAQERLTVILLRPNLEGLLRALDACGGPPAPLEKSHNARDAYLNKAVYELSKAVRDCVQEQQPDLKVLVRRLVELLRDSASP